MDFLRLFTRVEVRVQRFLPYRCVDVDAVPVSTGRGSVFPGSPVTIVFPVTQAASTWFRTASMLGHACPS